MEADRTEVVALEDKARCILRRLQRMTLIEGYKYKSLKDPTWPFDYETLTEKDDWKGKRKIVDLGNKTSRTSPNALTILGQV